MNLSVRFSNPKLVMRLACANARLQYVAGSDVLYSLFRHAEPGPALPQGFNGATSPDSSAQLGIVEFFNDLVLTPLDRAGTGGKSGAEDLGRGGPDRPQRGSGAARGYLPFVTTGANASLQRYSNFTLSGASIRDDPYQPGSFLPNPLPDYLLGLNLFWQLDIWRELRNARDAAAQRPRRHRATELLRDPTGRRDCRPLLPAHGARQTD